MTAIRIICPFAGVQEIGKSPAQIALNWLLQRPGVTAPILGARTMEQLEDNLGAVGWSLSMEQMELQDLKCIILYILSH